MNLQETLGLERASSPTHVLSDTRNSAINNQGPSVPRSRPQSGLVYLSEPFPITCRPSLSVLYLPLPQQSGSLELDAAEAQIRGKGPDLCGKRNVKGQGQREVKGREKQEGRFLKEVAWSSWRERIGRRSK